MQATMALPDLPNVEKSEMVTEADLLRMPKFSFMCVISNGMQKL
jgi:hypothetical protein